MSLIKCPECGREISDQAVQCPSCGCPINNRKNKKYCQHCGSQIDEDCIICPKCGKQVGILPANRTPSNPAPIVINNSTSSSSSTIVSSGYARYGKPVNKVIYCLLALFLGGIGIHKFYSGKTGMGILYILFCWTGIPAIIALIEFIIGLCKKSDEYGNIWF